MSKKPSIRIEAYDPTCGCWDSLSWTVDEDFPLTYWNVRKWLGMFMAPYSMFVALDSAGNIKKLGNIQ